MIERNLAAHLLRLAGWYPIVTVTGPRQSGKTTLCRAVFADKEYRNFEQADVREFARVDPRGFLAELPDGAVLDEAQHVPELLGYLQVEVDARPEPGRFVLTGSQHLGLSEAVSQSLAGRSGMAMLLPPGLDELRRFPGGSTDLWTTVWTGAFPRIHDAGIPAGQWLADYVFNYVQRDVRQVLNVGNLEAFTTFLRLCAGRTAQPLNLTGLGADAGVSQPTARAWLSVLETGLVCINLPAWHRNVRKQMTRAGKLHFVDAGLVCNLLGIGSPDELRHHSLRGPIFESWVASEVFKARLHAGEQPRVFHYRDARRLEVDLVVERDGQVDLVEVKSGATVAGDWFGPLQRLGRLATGVEADRDLALRLVYGGEEGARRQGTECIPWHAVADAGWR